MDHPSADNTGIEPIADLLAWAGHGALIIDHMSRAAPRSSDDAPPVDVVFRRLVRDALKQLEGRHAGADLAVTTDVLLDALRTIEDDLILVDPEADAS